MRVIQSEDIVYEVERLCIKSNYHLNDDIHKAIEAALLKEESQVGRDILNKLSMNAQLAAKKQIAICQDTGMAVVFVELGQDVHVIGTHISEAIDEGVRRGYKNGYLRNSVVEDPIFRKNTGDNTPAIIHYEMIPGDQLKIIVAPKGFGSENTSKIKMLNPSDKIEGVIDFVIETVDLAGPNSCPPVIVGVGIGGSFEKCAYLAKKALTRNINQHHSNPYYADLEMTLLEKINRLGIGPAGLGGRITALGVNIETYPTHIAGLPVAVNLCCHATRHAEVIL